MVQQEEAKETEQPGSTCGRSAVLINQAIAELEDESYQLVYRKLDKEDRRNIVAASIARTGVKMDSDCRRFEGIFINRDPLYICFWESKNGTRFSYVGDPAEFSALTGVMVKERKKLARPNCGPSAILFLELQHFGRQLKKEKTRCKSSAVTIHFKPQVNRADSVLKVLLERTFSRILP